ncbi:transportin-3 [Cylas formicarius]|uniref:transportin-3 n=1 Tax=Cylas formicarius TaxID=197179 RepID=UPI0029588585|nr:transportin-3 [Cylas formicarius]
MDQKPNLDIVVLAVSTLYKNPDRKEKEKASKWLLDLQKSVHAWTIADELLHQKRDLESCYFAAQTMRTKMHQSFYELPAEVHVSLRDSLLEHISQINEGTNTVIITQLCLALADLILQMPSWQRASLDLINRFSSQPYVWPLLEILTVLPEELESRSVRLGENRRVEVLEDLKLCAPTVIEFLKHCCITYSQNINDSIHIIARTIRCFTSWVSVGAVSLEGLTENVVINLAFQILDTRPPENKQTPGALCDAATECICTLLQCLEDNNNQQELENYLFNNIMHLEVPYHLSVANEDQGKSVDYCRLFTELAESFLEKIIANSGPNSMHYAIKILDLVLICVGHHDYEVAEITFNLWYVLSEELYQKNNKELTELFRPYIERLITALCRHCQMEPDQEGLLEDGDEFKDFRLKVSDLIKDVVFIVGSSSCFRQMFINLQAVNVTWDQSEAALFVMQAVAKNVLPSENEVVPKVVEAILHIPDSTHIAVQHTSVLLLGELCEWIEKHPVVLDPILNFLVVGLSRPGVGAAAAVALQNICGTCSDHMPRHVPILLQLLQQADTFAITNNAVMGLFKGVASIVTCLPPGEVTAAIREMCMMQLNPLCQLMEQDVVPVRGTKTDPVLWLDRLSSVLRHINITGLGEDEIHPCKVVVLEVWPVLSKTFDKYQSDIRIMERCCRSVRFMLRCASQQVRELLESLVGQIVRIYTLHKHSCFLYVGSILVDEYATDPQCIGGLLDMLRVFIEPTFQMLQEENGLRNHPDTVDDFFRLCARFIQRAALSFLRSSALVPILQCAIMAATLDHKEANMSVMKFFYDLINQGQVGHNQSDFPERRELVAGILNDCGQQLVTNLIQSCVFSLQSYMLSEVGDVILQLLEFNRDLTSKWLATGLDTLPKQSSGGIMAATPKQLSEVHSKLVRSNTSKSVTHGLKELTRFYR